MRFGTGVGQVGDHGYANITTGKPFSCSVGTQPSIGFDALCRAKCAFSALLSQPAEALAWGTLRSHNCPGVDQWRCRLAAGLRGVDEGVDFG